MFIINPFVTYYRKYTAKPKRRHDFQISLRQSYFLVDRSKVLVWARTHNTFHERNQNINYWACCKFSYSMVFSVLLYLAGLKHVADIYFPCRYYLHVISQNIYIQDAFLSWLPTDPP